MSAMPRYTKQVAINNVSTEVAELKRLFAQSEEDNVAIRLTWSPPSEVAELKDRIAELERRLEITQGCNYDGIDARDTTIKELERTFVLRELTDAEIDSCQRSGLIDSLLDPYAAESDGCEYDSIILDLREFARAILKAAQSK